MLLIGDDGGSGSARRSLIFIVGGSYGFGGHVGCLGLGWLVGFGSVHYFAAMVADGWISGEGKGSNFLDEWFSILHCNLLNAVAVFVLKIPCTI
jgi:hypothetical protein